MPLSLVAGDRPTHLNTLVGYWSLGQSVILTSTLTQDVTLTPPEALVARVV